MRAVFAATRQQLSLRWLLYSTQTPTSRQHLTLAQQPQRPSGIRAANAAIARADARLQRCVPLTQPANPRRLTTVRKCSCICGRCLGTGAAMRRLRRAPMGRSAQYSTQDAAVVVRNGGLQVGVTRVRITQRHEPPALFVAQARLHTRPSSAHATDEI